MTLGEFVQGWIKDHDRTDRWLAEKAKITHTYISDIRKNKWNVSPEILRKLSLAMEVPYVDLLILAGYLTEADLLRKSSGPIPPDVAAACSDPTMQKLIAAIWERTKQPCPMDVMHLLHWFLELPLSTQMKIWEDLKK